MRVVFYCFSAIIVLSCSTISAQNPFDPSMILMHYHGADTSAKVGYRISSIGDINSDSFDDLAVSSWSPFSTGIFLGGINPDSTPSMNIRGYWCRPVAFDLTGDGIDDLITSSEYYMYFFEGHGDSLASTPFDSLQYEPNALGRFIIADADYVDGDSVGDIVTYVPNTSGGPTVYYYEDVVSTDMNPDWSYHISDNQHLVSGLGFIDFDQDGSVDIFVGLERRLDTTGYVYIFPGPAFGESPSYIIGYPEGHDSLDIAWFAYKAENVGDFNSDGWEDIGVTYFGHLFIYCSSSTPDTLYDYWISRRINAMSTAGDINGDGYPDLVTGVGAGYDNGVHLYLGGQPPDVVTDMSIYSPSLPPLALYDIGYAVSDAGDFNGDGYDDFMFSCRNFSGGNPGDVFVVGGSPNIVTDVSDHEYKLLPNEFVLSQNYPNPFNPTTEIQFELPRKSEVVLDIFNVLGRRVRQLVNGPFSAGSHKVEWDGTDDNGEQVASGVYFYRLKAGEMSFTKKMVLLK